MIRAAVIGVGRMGRNHARVYHEMAGVTLVGVADTNYGRALQVRDDLGVDMAVSGDARYMLQMAQPHVVSVATPVADHLGSSMLALEFGCHVLVEKPIAATETEAVMMITCAHRMDRVLAVGHIERFNPAILSAKAVLTSKKLGRVRHVSTRRIGPAPDRPVDVGVVMDLAVHDLDLILYLLGPSRIAECGAFLRWAAHGKYEDVVHAILHLDTGVTCDIWADRVSGVKHRSMLIVGSGGMLRLDLLNKFGSLRVGSEAGVVLAPCIVEPLHAQLRNFVDAILTEAACPSVALGADGLEALRMAQAILERGRGGLSAEAVARLREGEK